MSSSDPKIAKRHWWLDCLFALLGSTCTIAAHKHVCKIGHLGLISPWFNEQILHAQTLKSTKRHWWLDCLFCTFGIYVYKSFLKTCWWNWFQVVNYYFCWKYLETENLKLPRLCRCWPLPRFGAEVRQLRSRGSWTLRTSSGSCCGPWVLPWSSWSNRWSHHRVGLRAAHNTLQRPEWPQQKQSTQSSFC